MLLGNRCTRNCRFCNVTPGEPEAPDREEPVRVAEAVCLLSLQHAVLTSVTRDDLSDGGAWIWADTIRQMRARNPDCRIEVLIPDFQGQTDALALIFNARPDILGHNIETVPRLYPRVRPQADYQRSLNVLRAAKDAALTTKSGMMLGMGETHTEVSDVMRDVRAVGCDILTLGQYLQPTPLHVAVKRYWTPAEFEELKREGEHAGFLHVEAGALVRSSYHADQFPQISER